MEVPKRSPSPLQVVAAEVASLQQTVERVPTAARHRGAQQRQILSDTAAHGIKYDAGLPAGAGTHIVQQSLRKVLQPSDDPFGMTTQRTPFTMSRQITGGLQRYNSDIEASNQADLQLDITGTVAAEAQPLKWQTLLRSTYLKAEQMLGGNFTMQPTKSEQMAATKTMDTLDAGTTGISEMQPSLHEVIAAAVRSDRLMQQADTTSCVLEVCDAMLEVLDAATTVLQFASVQPETEGDDEDSTLMKIEEEKLRFRANMQAFVVRLSSIVDLPHLERLLDAHTQVFDKLFFAFSKLRLCTVSKEAHLASQANHAFEVSELSEDFRLQVQLITNDFHKRLDWAKSDLIHKCTTVTNQLTEQHQQAMNDAAAREEAVLWELTQVQEHLSRQREDHLETEARYSILIGDYNEVTSTLRRCVNEKTLFEQQLEKLESSHQCELDDQLAAMRSTYEGRYEELARLLDVSKKDSAEFQRECNYLQTCVTELQAEHTGLTAAHLHCQQTIGSLHDERTLSHTRSDELHTSLRTIQEESDRFRADCASKAEQCVHLQQQLEEEQRRSAEKLQAAQELYLGQLDAAEARYDGVRCTLLAELQDLQSWRQEHERSLTRVLSTCPVFSFEVVPIAQQEIVKEIRPYHTPPGACVSQHLVTHSFHPTVSADSIDSAVLLDAMQNDYKVLLEQFQRVSAGTSRIPTEASPQGCHQHQAEIVSLKSELQELHQNLVTAQEELRRLQSGAAGAEFAAAEASSFQTETSASHQDSQNTCTALREVLTQTQGDLARTTALLRVADEETQCCSTQLNSLRTEYSAVKSAADATAKRLQDTLRENESVGSTAKQLSNRVLQLTAERDEAVAEGKIVASESAILRSKCNEYRQLATELQKAIEANKQALEGKLKTAVETQTQVLQQQILSERSKCKLLEKKCRDLEELGATQHQAIPWATTRASAEEDASILRWSRGLRVDASKSGSDLLNQQQDAFDNRSSRIGESQESLSAEVALQRQHNELLTTKVDELTRNLAASQKEAEKLVSEIAVQSQTNERLTKQLDEARAELSTYQLEIGTCRLELASHEDRNNSLQQQLESLQEQLVGTQAALETSNSLASHREAESSNVQQALYQRLTRAIDDVLHANAEADNFKAQMSIADEEKASVIASMQRQLDAKDAQILSLTAAKAESQLQASESHKSLLDLQRRSPSKQYSTALTPARTDSLRRAHEQDIAQLTASFDKDRSILEQENQRVFIMLKEMSSAQQTAAAEAAAAQRQLSTLRATAAANEVAKSSALVRVTQLEDAVASANTGREELRAALHLLRDQVATQSRQITELLSQSQSIPDASKSSSTGLKELQVSAIINRQLQDGDAASVARLEQSNAILTSDLSVLQTRALELSQENVRLVQACQLSQQTARDLQVRLERLHVERDSLQDSLQELRFKSLQDAEKFQSSLEELSHEIVQRTVTSDAARSLPTPLHSMELRVAALQQHVDSLLVDQHAHRQKVLAADGMIESLTRKLEVVTNGERSVREQLVQMHSKMLAVQQDASSHRELALRVFNAFESALYQLCKAVHLEPQSSQLSLEEKSSDFEAIGARTHQLQLLCLSLLQLVRNWRDDRQLCSASHARLSEFQALESEREHTEQLEELLASANARIAELATMKEQPKTVGGSALVARVGLLADTAEASAASEIQHLKQQMALLEHHHSAVVRDMQSRYGQQSVCLSDTQAAVVELQSNLAAADKRYVDCLEQLQVMANQLGLCKAQLTDASKPHHLQAKEGHEPSATIEVSRLSQSILTLEDAASSQREELGRVAQMLREEISANARLQDASLRAGNALMIAEQRLANLVSAVTSFTDSLAVMLPLFSSPSRLGLMQDLRDAVVRCCATIDSVIDVQSAPLATVIDQLLALLLRTLHESSVDDQGAAPGVVEHLPPASVQPLTLADLISSRETRRSVRMDTHASFDASLETIGMLQHLRKAARDVQHAAIAADQARLRLSTKVGGSSMHAAASVGTHLDKATLLRQSLLGSDFHSSSVPQSAVAGLKSPGTPRHMRPYRRAKSPHTLESGIPVTNDG